MISECGVSPENILAVTFSKKAKENIQNRLQGKCNGVNIETFHSVALKIVQGYSKSRYELWLKQWEKENCLFEICHSMGICKTKDEMEYNDLMIFISTQKTNMKTPDNPIVDRKYAYSNSVMKEIYKQYEAYKEKNKLIKKLKKQGREKEISEKLEEFSKRWEENKLPKDLCYLEKQDYRNYLKDRHMI